MYRYATESTTKLHPLPILTIMDKYANSSSNNNRPSSSSFSTTSLAPKRLHQNASVPTQRLPSLQQRATHTDPDPAQHTWIYGQWEILLEEQPGHFSPVPPPAQHQKPIQPYSNPSGMMPQGSSPPHTQAIAPAPGPTNNHLVPLRPVNSSTPLHAQHPMHQQMQGGMGSPYGQRGSTHEEAPTHVVESQGRRGILFSASRRPFVAATSLGASKNGQTPVQDAGRKFPCLHCVKTYLHAKHLKRHLLRHTGERPYMCVLCRDTFSRSDVLKRHFQKCAIRRGNPTGASHLSHALPHLKKNQPAHKNALLATTKGDTIRNMDVLNGVPTDPSLHPFNLMANRPVPDGQRTNLNDDQLSQGHISRARSTMGEIQSTMASKNPQLAAYPIPNGHHVLSNSHSGQQYSHQGPPSRQNGHQYRHGGPPYREHYKYPGQDNGSSLQQQQQQQAAAEEMESMAKGRCSMPIYSNLSNLDLI
ncbi:hypothetical protein V496_01689 [Pseudogymnoascus sp. VKM F-4515 (FW-2607)]|nr:hypothetical protein V496_01689 [Pseudogymnoascus sp. VKM F-4515 (FW-2607)]